MVCGDERLSYRELEDRANLLAHHLRGLGVGPEEVVGLCVERSVDLVVGLLGILKAGGAYLPLDASYPGERLVFMVGDAGARIVVTQAGLAARLGLRASAPAPTEARPAAPGPQAPGWPVGAVVLLDAQWPLIAAAATVAAGPAAARAAARVPARVPARVAAPAHGLSPHNAAYVIYTSGSSGTPKGVVVSHAGLQNLLAAMQAEQLAPTDRLLAVTTVSFDIAALELYLPLISGASVVVAERASVTDARALARTIARSGASVMQATPTLWQSLLSEGGAELGHLRAMQVLVGGEALTESLAHSLRGLGRRLINLYGPTETTIWSTAMALADGGG